MKYLLFLLFIFSCSHLLFVNEKKHVNMKRVSGKSRKHWALYCVIWFIVSLLPLIYVMFGIATHTFMDRINIIITALLVLLCFNMNIIYIVLLYKLSGKET